MDPTPPLPEAHSSESHPPGAHPTNHSTRPPNHPSSNTITTPRLLLRPLQASDTDAFHALRSNPDVAVSTRHGKPMTRAQNDEFLRKQLARRNGMSYCVELRHDNGIKDKGQVEGGLDGRGDMIGITGGHDLPEVGYLFEPGAWGKGYATEALKGFIDYYWKLFPEGHLALDGEEKDYLIAFTSPNGVASRRVLHKCGFRHWKFAEEEDEKGEGKEEGEVGQQGVQGERKNETGDTKEKVMLHVWRLERPVVG